MLTCPACATRLHAGCQRELGGCATLGCRGARRADPPDVSFLHGAKAVALAAACAWALATVQGLLLTRHTPTPSDVVAASVTALIVTVALGVWLDAGLRRRLANACAVPLTTYVGVGFASSASPLHGAVWLVASGALFGVWVARSVRAVPGAR
ncbi:MAG: hypothetical protein R3F62_09635 [Planctomycetota bacterium]